MKAIDLSEILPEKTSRGDDILSDIYDEEINVNYTRKRGRPVPYMINRYVGRENFLVGITIWACEGTRRRPHELEISNSSDDLANMYMSLLRELGIDKYARFRVQAIEDDVESCELFWEKCLKIKKKGKPITHIRKIRENSNGIVNIRINSTILRELFVYWANNLPSFLQ